MARCAQTVETIGELATRGRLGKASFGYPFVHPIANAVSEVEYRHSKKVFRGSAVDEKAFVVLWAGGYNTWTDVDLLYEALTRAMDEVPELRFVSFTVDPVPSTACGTTWTENQCTFTIAPTTDSGAWSRPRSWKSWKAINDIGISFPRPNRSSASAGSTDPWVACSAAPISRWHSCG